MNLYFVLIHMTLEINKKIMYHIYIVFTPRDKKKVELYLKKSRKHITSILNKIYSKY